MKYITTINDEEFIIEIEQNNQIVVNGERYDIDFQHLPEADVLSLLLDHQSFEAVVEARDDVWDVLTKGELYTVKVQDERAYRLAKARGVIGEVTGEAQIKSPMPGLIVAVPVNEGQQVEKGDKIIILESMKMENELRAPKAGIVARIHAEPGASVEKDQVLAVIVDEEE
ncbi:MAG: acetyl-CoA carboxylase biotin carboxyl carrier protein subunit [Ardenticatenaceae bacterium]|nr:MAG: acetyl-CoA carboxylase biotin carboxyl carrier protein subunit [Ardenticatenaceae bacterium]